MLGKLLPVLFLSVFILLPSSAEFVDVPKGHWAEASVKKVTQDHQIMSGYPGNKFSGSGNLTRYEAASIINKLFDNFGKEFDKDREDLANLLEVMELFQGEMRTVKDEVKKRDIKIDELTKMSAALAAENQRLTVQLDTLNTDIQGIKMRDAAKLAEKPKKKSFLFGAKKSENTKKQKPQVKKEEKKTEKKEKKVKDKQETEQTEEQTSTMNKELPQAAPDYADEYQH